MPHFLSIIYTEAVLAYVTRQVNVIQFLVMTDFVIKGVFCIITDKLDKNQSYHMFVFLW